MNSAAINKVPAPCHIPVQTGHPRMDKIVPVLPHRVYGPSWSRLLGFAKSLSQVSSGESHGNPLQYSCLENPVDRGAWWAAVHGVAKSCVRLSDFTFTFHFHALEKEMVTHSSVLAWRIPGMGKPGGLPSMGSHRARYD